MHARAVLGAGKGVLFRELSVPREVPLLRKEVTFLSLSRRLGTHLTLPYLP